MPLEYPSGTVTEHKAVRSGCGLFDVSHMGTVYVRGPEAITALNGLLTNDIDRLADQEVQYSLLCNEAGGVIDDMLVTRLSPSLVMIVPNAANTEAVVSVVCESVGAESVLDVSAETAIIAVQGPSSASVLAELGLPTDHEYMTVASAEFDGIEITVSRTGYTGERGYELMAPNAIAPALWEEIQDSPRVAPAGLGARDTLRTEMGYALHGQDISPTTTPVEALLSWAVAWDKPHFAGAAALRKQREQGAGRKLRGIRLTGRGVPRPGMAVLLNGEPVGQFTSGTFSPSLREGIGLALLDSAVQLGDGVAVDVRGRKIAAEVVRPPFVASSPK